MKKPALTGHAVFDLFGHSPADQFFDELEKQYGFDAARSMVLTAVERASRRQPRRTKPTGPHDPVEAQRLVLLWKIWGREHPGEGKYAWEQWCFETFGWPRRKKAPSFAGSMTRWTNNKPRRRNSRSYYFSDDDELAACFSCAGICTGAHHL